MSCEVIQIGTRKFKILFPDLLRPLTDREFADLRESIRREGVLSPVIVTQDDGVIDGIHRLRAAKAEGLRRVPVVVKPESPARARDLALTLNTDRRHLTPDELQRVRAERIERVAAKRAEGKSLRAIADEEGVSPEQVRQDVKQATVKGLTVEPAGGTVTGRDGKTRTATPKPRAGCIAYKDLDAGTREILGNRKIIDDTKQMRALLRIKDRDERHRVARLLADGKARTVNNARALLGRMRLDARLEGTRPAACGADAMTKTVREMVAQASVLADDYLAGGEWLAVGAVTGHLRQKLPPERLMWYYRQRDPAAADRQGKTLDALLDEAASLLAHEVVELKSCESERRGKVLWLRLPPAAAHTDAEPDPENNPEDRKVRGKGIMLANEAINCLTRIPQDDALRKRAGQLVTDWIKTHITKPTKAEREAEFAARTRLKDVWPLLDELDYWGKAHEGQMSPVAIKQLAIKLRRVIDGIVARGEIVAPDVDSCPNNAV